MAATIDTGSFSTATTGTGTAVTVNAPVGVVSGDLVVVEICADSGISVASAPSGFSALLEIPESGNMMGVLYGKVATGSEPSTYAFTLTLSSSAWRGIAYIVDGADLSSFPTSTNGGTQTASNTGTSVTVPQVTMTTDGLLLGQCVSRSGSATISSNGGVMTANYTTATFGSRRTRSFRESPSAGATGTRTFDVGDSTTHVAGLLVINAATAPAGGGAITPLLLRYINNW